jgi:hypothetical protein
MSLDPFVRFILTEFVAPSTGRSIESIEADIEKHGGFTREVLIHLLYANAKQAGTIDYHENPVFVSYDPLSEDSVTFERKQYGNAIVIEAEGYIVERLCQ